MNFNIKIINIPAIILYVIPVLLLIPILFFPMSFDLSIYITAGKIISNGGKIYVDYVDLKPPLFYYLYTLIYKLTSGTEFNVRLFDFFWQIATLIVLYKVTNKIFNNKIVSFLTAVIYSISYTCLTYIETMNPESFAGLPILLIIFLELKESNKIPKQILQGLLIGFLIGIKFTFAIILPAIFIADIINNHNNYREYIKKYFLLGLSSLIIILLSFIQLLNPVIFLGFKNVLAFLNFYSSQPPLNMEFLKMLLKNLAVLFADNYSLFLSVIMGISTFYLLKNLRKFNSRIIIYILSLTIFLLISVIVEKKSSIIHFSRIYTLFAVLTGYGLYIVYNEAVEIIRIKKKLLLLFIPLCVIIAMLSPITRYINIIIPSFYYITDRAKYDVISTKTGDYNILRNTSREISYYINCNARKEDYVIVMAIGSNIINNMFKTEKISKFSQSCFYFSNINIPDWKSDIFNEIKKAEYIVISFDDKHPMLTGHNFSTYERLMQNHEMSEYLLNYFYLDKVFPPFKIFKRYHK